MSGTPPPHGGPDLAGAGNPYANLTPMDLSEASFEKIAALDEAQVATIVAEVAALTQSNLDAAAKWNGYLRILDSTLRSVGMVARIAALA
jgi:hypothetical protein